MLQRAILQAIDMEAHHTLHMHLESRDDSRISTTALMHKIVQYYASYVCKKAGATAMAISSANCIKPCDVCGVGKHWIRDCHGVNRAKELVSQEARVEAARGDAVLATAVAGAARGLGFWETADFYMVGDGTIL